MTSEVFNMDCVEYMRTLPDNFFDVAICDPPYGDADSEKLGGGRFGGRFDRYKKPQNTPPNQRQEAYWNPHTRRNVGDKVQAPVNHACGGRFSRYSGGGGKLTASYNALTGMLPHRKSFSMNFSE